MQQSTGRQNLQNSFRAWMRSNAPDPKLYDKLDRIYTFSMIPNVIFFNPFFCKFEYADGFSKGFDSRLVCVTCCYYSCNNSRNIL